MGMRLAARSFPTAHAQPLYAGSSSCSANATLHEPDDAVVRVEAVTICGTVLHILGGDVPEVTPGRVLGHEAVGIVTAVGARVHKPAVGDRVLVSCVSSCGSCRYCRVGSYGARAWAAAGFSAISSTAPRQYVRVPLADNCTYKVPSGVTAESVLLVGSERKVAGYADGIPPPEQDLAQLELAGLLPPPLELFDIEPLGFADHVSSVRPVPGLSTAVNRVRAFGGRPEGW